MGMLQNQMYRLVIKLAVEGEADGLHEQASVLVAGRVSYDGDVAARNHLWRVSNDC
jgi:hypothetical protein